MISTVSYAQHKHSTPQLGASYAFDSANRLWMVAVSPNQELFIQNSSDFGKTWGNRQVLKVDEKISAEGENRPKILFGSRGQAVITYTKPMSKPYTGEIRYIYSADGEKFSLPSTLHDDRQEITHRFDSIIFDVNGGLHAFWIDKRDSEFARTKKDKRDSYEGAALYRKYSADGGLTWSSDIKLADHTCECCRIALTALSDGRIAVLWRHVFPGSIRDHAVTLVLGEKQDDIFHATHDQWKVQACPHHGPALDHDDHGFYAVWFSERQGKATVKYGVLDWKKSTANYVDLPDPQAEHADVAVNGQKIVVAWRSFDGEKTSLYIWTSGNHGQSFEKKLMMQSDLDNDYPKLLKNANNIYLIWRTQKDIYVQKIP
jgi:hypothetical protein